jgi:hypothetical protein
MPEYKPTIDPEPAHEHTDEEDEGKRQTNPSVPTMNLMMK